MTEARPMIPAYPALARSYDAGFRVDDAYKAGLPDLQNGPASLIIGARRACRSAITPATAERSCWKPA